MKKYLFLDIDGVLVNRQSLSSKKWMDDGRQVFNNDCVELLNQIVEKTDCFIIITSEWRKRASIDELRDIFALRGFKFSNKIIDKTISINPETTQRYSWVHVPRGTEIRQWLMSFIVDNGKNNYQKLNTDYTYVIIDDDNDMLYEQRNNFVNTNFEIGLTQENVDAAIKILNNEQ